MAGGCMSDSSSVEPIHASNGRSNASDDDNSHALLRFLERPLQRSRGEMDELFPKPKLTLSYLLRIDYARDAKVTQLLELAKKQNSSNAASSQNNGQPASNITINGHELKAAYKKILTTYFLEPLKEEAAASIALATATSGAASKAASDTNRHLSPEQQQHSPAQHTPKPRSRYDTLVFLERIITIGRFVRLLLELQACSKDDGHDSPTALAKKLAQHIAIALREIAQEEIELHETNDHSRLMDAADLHAENANNLYWEKDCRDLPKERFNIGMIVMMVFGSLQPFHTYYKQQPFQIQLWKSLVDIATLYGAPYNSTPILLLPSALVQRLVLSFATFIRCKLQPLLRDVTYCVKSNSEMNQDDTQGVVHQLDFLNCASTYMTALFNLPTAAVDNRIDGRSGQLREHRDFQGMDPAVQDTTIPVLLMRLGLAKLVESTATVDGTPTIPVASAAIENALSAWLDTQVKVFHHHNAVFWSIVRCEPPLKDGLSKIENADEKAVAEASFYLGKATILSKFLETTLSDVSVDWSSDVSNGVLTSAIEELLLRSLPAAVVKSDALLCSRATKSNRGQLLRHSLQIIFKVLLRIEVGSRPESRERSPTSCPTCCFHRLLVSWMQHSAAQHPLAQQMLLTLVQGRCELALRLANGTQKCCPFLAFMASLLFHRQTTLALRKAISSLFLRLLRLFRHQPIRALVQRVLSKQLSENVALDLSETPTISSLDDERHFTAISAVVVELETRDETKTLVYGHRMQQILCVAWDQDETESWWLVRLAKLYQCRVYLSKRNRRPSKRDVDAAIQLVVEIADGKTHEYSNAADRSRFELIRLLLVLGPSTIEHLLERLEVCFQAAFASENWPMQEDALTLFTKLYRIVPQQHQIVMESWAPDQMKKAFQCRLKDPLRRKATIPGEKLARCHLSLLSTSDPGLTATPSLPTDITDDEAAAINSDAVLRYERAKERSTVGDHSDNLVLSEIDLLCARSDRLAILQHVAATAGSKVYIGAQLDEECIPSILCQEAEQGLPRNVQSQFGLLLLGQVSSAELLFQKHHHCCRQPSLLPRSSGNDDSIFGLDDANATPGTKRENANAHTNDPQEHKRAKLDNSANLLSKLPANLVERIRNEIMEDTSDVTFEDIAGLKNQLAKIKEGAIWPLKRPGLFRTGGRSPPKGLLLFGPPGTGKTFIGKAIAREANATFFSISSSSLTSKWVGDGEMLVRCMFAVARAEAPSIIFFDEVDSLLMKREERENECTRRMKTEFLVCWDGLQSNKQEQLFLIGATNFPDHLDEAARRRFTTRLYIPLPDAEGRKELISKFLAKANIRLSNKKVQALVALTDRFSGADLQELCSDAALGPIRQLGPEAIEEVEEEEVPPAAYEHFRKSLKNMKPSVSPAQLVRYETWNEEFGSKACNQSDDDEVYSDDDDDEDDDDNDVPQNH